MYHQITLGTAEIVFTHPMPYLAKYSDRALKFMDHGGERASCAVLSGILLLGVKVGLFFLRLLSTSYSIRRTGQLRQCPTSLSPRTIIFASQTILKPPSTSSMPREVSDIKQFIEICRRKDASCESPNSFHSIAHIRARTTQSPNLSFGRKARKRPRHALRP